MSKPIFSILVANYNNGHFFKDCYQSIINQTYYNWEVIIVDDASTNDSVSVIKDLIKNDTRFKIFQNEINKGCGYTKHRCATLAKGEVLGFLDPDDTLVPEALDCMVQAHLSDKDIAIVTSKYEFVDLEMNFTKLGVHGSSIPKGKSYLTYGKGALTHFATFKKVSYQSSGGINPIMKRAVDQDLYYKLEEQGSHMFLEEVLYRYRVHKNSISNNKNLFKAEYWHFYAKLKAYKRRKKNQTKIDNFTKQYIEEFASNYYLKRFERLKFSKKKWSQYYLLFKAIGANPMHRTSFKIKSLVVLILRRI
ncbi:glycosyltransferase [Tamlana sp. 2_MG-2023]|uniref:glycosyltransferase family 2 protein n=1 Tax=unclassified Tamlana TaxID=2614803 RepID=UPI0026E2DD19|nr:MULTISPECIES: glycosyltransferase family 2 protein [unclassified Tamlana]MDO6758743.1 glycosyltransferase [Tamlana sp. 2_MG-2023]MDO6789442.1 glycosyltransferase [Tamlana sp. 1_MG-2023]